MSHLDYGSTSGPCWHCHWFGFIRAGNGNGFCINPKLSPVQAIPHNGCAFWVREAGTDDQSHPPTEVEESSPEGLSAQRRRARLVRIREDAQRMVRLPHGYYVEVSDATGVLIAETGTVLGLGLPDAQAAIEALGIQKAIRAGRR